MRGIPRNYHWPQADLAAIKGSQAESYAARSFSKHTSCGICQATFNDTEARALVVEASRVGTLERFQLSAVVTHPSCHPAALQTGPPIDPSDAPDVLEGSHLGAVMHGERQDGAPLTIPLLIWNIPFSITKQVSATEFHDPITGILLEKGMTLLGSPDPIDIVNAAVTTDISSMWVETDRRTLSVHWHDEHLGASPILYGLDENTLPEEFMTAAAEGQAIILVVGQSIVFSHDFQEWDASHDQHNGSLLTGVLSVRS